MPSPSTPSDSDDDEPSIAVEGEVQPNPTIHLETADLKELAESGELADRASSPEKQRNPLTMANNVLVDLDAGKPKPEPRPGSPLHVRRVTPTRPRVDLGRRATEAEAQRTSGIWLVVLVYVICAAALAASIYYRFVA